MASGLSCRLESQDAAGALNSSRKVLVSLWSPVHHPLTGNEPHAADIPKALEPAWLTLRQVRVAAARSTQSLTEFRLIKLLEGFERLETLTLSAETVYKQYPENPPGRGKTLVKLMLPTLWILEICSIRALPYEAVLNVAEQTAVCEFPSLRLVDLAEHWWESGVGAGICPYIGEARVHTIRRLLAKAGVEVIPPVTCTVSRRGTTPIIPVIQARN